MLEVPDFALKLGRAEHHLIDLERLLARFTDTHPYTVSHTIEGKKQRDVWRLTFTTAPHCDISLLAGDFLYNVRASLEYLAGALVPSSERSHVMFPLVSEPVWDIPKVEGENEERTKSRERWITTTRKMHADAVAILKWIQPLKSAIGPPPDAGELHKLLALDVLNRLSNQDRHRKLTVAWAGLREPETRTTMNDGSIVGWGPSPAPAHLSPGNGTEIVAPPGAVNVEIRGTPAVLISLGDPDLNVLLPERFRDLLDHVRNDIVVPLSPYLHRAPPKRRSTVKG